MKDQQVPVWFQDPAMQNLFEQIVRNKTCDDVCDQNILKKASEEVVRRFREYDDE